MHMHTCIYISPQLVHARLCNGAAAFLPWKLLQTYLESCANITVVTAHPLSYRPPSCPFVEPAALLLAHIQTCSLKKSDQIHESS